MSYHSGGVKIDRGRTESRRIENEMQSRVSKVETLISQMIPFC